MSESHDLRDVGRFTVGAIGEPGRRVFYFQVFADGVEVAVKCEKQQAQALAEHLERLLDDLPHDAAAAASAAEALPPTELLWPVGSISLGVDRDERRLLVMFEEMVEPDDEGELTAEPAQVRLRISPQQVQAYVAQVEALLATSRPICRLCDAPIDPSGHACPRLN
ncbi:MAG: hypothetical protein JWO77_428 [Ilumatobacteraceae bacterium]|nr:hypothetical protein [Ilumatobacteraceae bacterium]